MKEYGKEYYDRWYGENPIMTPTTRLWRSILATAVVGRVLGHGIRSILDVGCGMALWREPLLKLNPEATYFGIDPSEYCRYNFHTWKAGLADLSEVAGSYDLVLCVDVLHFVEEQEMWKALPELRRLTGGVLYATMGTANDRNEGDLDGYIDRTAAWYRAAAGRVGFCELGLGFWTPWENARSLSMLEVQI